VAHVGLLEEGAHATLRAERRQMNRRNQERRISRPPLNGGLIYRSLRCIRFAQRPAANIFSNGESEECLMMGFLAYIPGI